MLDKEGFCTVRQFSDFTRGSHLFDIIEIEDIKYLLNEILFSVFPKG